MSALEDTFAMQLKAVGIPFEREAGFHPTRRWRLDFLIGKLAVEIDGGLFVNGGHNRGVQRQKDYEKDAEAWLRGIHVMRVSSGQVKSGQALQWVERAVGLDLDERCRVAGL